MQTHDFYTKLTKNIELNITDFKHNGLFTGKMGYTIYLFYLSRYLNDPTYEQKGEDLIEEICKSIDVSTIINFHDGLAGIAWGVEHLTKQKFVNADTDVVLKEIDDKIFREIASRSTEELRTLSDALYGIAFYLIERIKHRKNEDNEYTRFTKDLLILIFNALEERNIKDGYSTLKEEPWIFSLAEYRLPIYLYLITELYKLDFYNYKLDRIIEGVIPIVQGCFPRLISNRIYLLSTLTHLLKQKRILQWKEIKQLLENNIDVAQMLREEFYDKSINFNNGLSGILFLLTLLPPSIHVEDMKSEIEKKILNSSYFHVDTPDTNANKDISLFTGRTGIALSLLINDMFHHSTTPNNEK
ncbi:lanthionine synthetase LanC family protein [Parabacteroides pacaensis]|uniref:lanthionine synthetase LanC family protein n=1 Tax=Parabacteroides pacaensis TaxID=2086575 RepID=UPI000D0E93BD|nr:lanthionine synthetase LanC family protein [Parabacteroides pacaensis]